MRQSVIAGPFIALDQLAGAASRSAVTTPFGTIERLGGRAMTTTVVKGSH